MYQWDRWSHSGVILSQMKNAPQTMYADDIQQVPSYDLAHVREVPMRVIKYRV